MLHLAVAVLLCQLLVLPAGVAAKDEPTITVSDFDHSPNNLAYFENSDVVLFQDEAAGSVYRSDNGGVKWSKVDAIGDGEAMAVVMHEFDKDRAYVLTQGKKHWRTEDQGRSWKAFATNADLSIFRSNWLVFHAEDKDRILFNGMDCQSIFCEEIVTYTTDGFASDAKLLRGNTEGCWWAKSSELFTTNGDKYNSNRILCIVRDEMSLFKHENRLLISDSFFKKADGAVTEFEPKLDGTHSIQGVVNLAVVKKYLVVATTSKNTDEMALYVTDDTLSWHRAEFPSDHRINQEAYTVLEGTNYSIQVDVMTTRPSNPMGVMLTSNSNGTYFTRNLEHTNRNSMGHVDFEKISGIQGIFLVNQVDNWKEVQNGPGATKKMKTKITFDDGRTFESVRAGDKEIHLHSVTELNNVGRVFSSPAPGLVMGNGNRGDHLKDYKDANLYVSDDAGKTWIKALDGPHKYEFGDQGSVLVAVRDIVDHKSDETVHEIRYSLNHGQDWQTMALPDKLKIQPWVLTTTQDSSSLKFILTGKTLGKSPNFHIISIDFDGLHEDTCKDSDMEDWYARKDDKGDPSCLMGNTQKFHRRKKNAKCFVKKTPAPPESTPCECSEADYECDFNFVRKDNECVKAGPIAAPPGACKGTDPDETFKGSSGWRRIPGNNCTPRKAAKEKDDQVERKCSEASAPSSPPASGNITHTQTLIKGSYDTFDKHYLERGENSQDKGETIIMRPTKGTAKAGDIRITQDHGKTWTTPEALKDAPVWMIATHQYIKDVVFFISNERKVIYSFDRGVTFDSFEAPLPPKTYKGGMMPLSFHPDKKDWLIWHGEKCPENAKSGDDGCHIEASISHDRGDNWRTMLRWVDKCEFTGGDAYKNYGRQNVKEMICSARSQENKKAPFQLVWSDDFFDLKKEVRIENVKNYATMAEFIIVASANDTSKSLQASASLNGRDFADADFPYGMNEKKPEFTVLDSSTHAVNLFSATNNEPGRRFGSILKSNSNGTSYVLGVSGVNCDDDYYVDFEKMLGVQGVVLVNVVQNQQADKSEKKHLQTKISHDDGARWSFLPPPAKDVEGKDFDCRSDKGDEKCALQIHGFTERVDHRKTYSSESAVGIMFGWGNVGSMLGDVKKADTFMTTDAGITWQMVKKGQWTWTFGDQGSIVVLAQQETRTKTVVYTLDEGKTWNDYTFSDEEVWIDDITTLRSGSSRNFLLWGHKGKEKKKGDELLTVNLDFTGLTNKACHADEDPSKSDYVLWSPEHPNEPNGCLFGHQAMYWRKKTDRTCFNDHTRQPLYGLKNCTCNRQDFEW